MTEFKLDKNKFELVSTDTEKQVARYEYSDKDVLKEALEANEIKYVDYIKFRKFDKSFAKEAVVASKELAQEVLLKDKKLRGVTVSVPFGKNQEVSTNVIREVTGINRLPGNDPTPYKTSSLVVKVKESKVSSAFIKELKNELTAALIK